MNVGSFQPIVARPLFLPQLPPVHLRLPIDNLSAYYTQTAFGYKDLLLHVTAAPIHKTLLHVLPAFLLCSALLQVALFGQ